MPIDVGVRIVLAAEEHHAALHPRFGYAAAQRRVVAVAYDVPHRVHAPRQHPCEYSRNALEVLGVAVAAHGEQP